MHVLATVSGAVGLAALALYAQEYRGLALASLGLLIVLAVLEQKYPKDRQGRKTVHYLGGVSAAFFILLAGARIASTLLALGMIALVVISKLLRRGVYVPLFSEGIDKLEREGVAPLYGSINFFLGGALATALFPEHAALGMLAVGAGDGFSTVVGMHFGKHRIGKKSVEGALAFFAGTLVLCAQIVPLESAIVAALAGAIVELLPIGIDDNITIPLGVAGVLATLSV